MSKKQTPEYFRDLYANNENRRARIKAAAAAQSRAEARLKAMYPSLYAALYAEEKAKMFAQRGLS